MCGRFGHGVLRCTYDPHPSSFVICSFHDVSPVYYDVPFAEEVRNITGGVCSFEVSLACLVL